MIRAIAVALLLVAPPADRDGDGVPDRADLCQDEAEDRDGFDDGDGCPDADCDDCGWAGGRFVPFRRADARLAPAVRAAVDRLARELRAAPARVIEIRGHVAVGEPASLAAARAAAVYRYLVAHGVPARRLRRAALPDGGARVDFRQVAPRELPGG